MAGQMGKAILLGVLAWPELVASLNLHAHSGLSHITDKNCPCLPWKDVYEKYGVDCKEGGGMEVLKPKDGGDAEAMNFIESKATCRNFYMKASFNACLNNDFYSMEQWCFIPQSCGGDHVLGTQVSTTICTPQDRRDKLWLKSPEEINRLAKADNLDVGLLGRLAWRFKETKWSDVEGASVLSISEMPKAHMVEASYSGRNWTEADLKDSTDEARRVLEDAMEVSHPVAFESDNHMGGGTIVWGRKVYAFKHRDEAPDEPMEYECVHGCDY